MTSTTAPEPTLAPSIATHTADPLFLGSELSRIYSKDDPDVTPAQLLSGQSTAGLSTVLSDINTMELVISKMGRVETVKLSAPPKRMTDMLLLSGAKTWKFAPAMKDGQPVRYRTQVSWETTR